jgi:glycerol-3-phosphate dehydrogenase
MQMAPRVARILAVELGRDQRWQENQIQQFQEVARGYFVKK